MNHEQKISEKGTSRTLQDNKRKDKRQKVEVATEIKHHLVEEEVPVDSGIIEMIMKQVIHRTPDMEATKKMILNQAKMHLTLILDKRISKMMKGIMERD